MRAGHAGAVNGIGFEEFRAAARFADGVDARLAALGIAAKDGNLRAGTGQSFRERAAEHAGRADDNGYFR